MRPAAILSAVALGMGVPSCGGGDPSPVSPADGPGAARLDKAATASAYAFLDTYTTDDGRIQRTDQGGDTVGEGQAYGLLAAAAVGDPQRFDRIWAWTQANMTRPDGLLAFRWADGRVQDPEAAADADLDAARALLVAACRFKRPELRAAAVRIGRAVLAHQTARSGRGTVLLAGPWADQAGRLTINPSYVDPTTLGALARVTGDARFHTLAADARRLTGELARPLPPDWATVDARSGRVTPVSSADATAGPGRFTFDAPRTLVRFAADPEPAGRRLAARAWEVFKDTTPQDIVVEHELDGSPAGGTRSPVTLAAAAGAAKAAGDRAAVAKLLGEAQRLHKGHPTYYGGAWVALGRLMLTTERLQPCTSG